MRLRPREELQTSSFTPYLNIALGVTSGWLSSGCHGNDSPALLSHGVRVHIFHRWAESIYIIGDVDGLRGALMLSERWQLEQIATDG